MTQNDLVETSNLAAVRLRLKRKPQTAGAAETDFIKAVSGLLWCNLVSAVWFVSSLFSVVQPRTTAAQHYTFRNLPIVGGGFLDGIVAHPNQRGLFYARTDVGGAYRYDIVTAAWAPLTDWVPPAQWQYMGIESIAIDPRNPQKLYLAAGMYIEHWDGNGAILISSDQGATFKTVPMPFRMGGNDPGRNGGERLQVDPNLGSILFYGTYAHGLWKSTDSGQTWSNVASLPVHGPTDGAGVIFVAFDPGFGSPGKATRTIFAGVSTAHGPHLYRTDDGGTTWSAVPGQPTGLFPNHGMVTADGMLFLTYADAMGPTDMTKGAVWRYRIADGAWTDITPPNPAHYRFGYGGLALDAQRPGRLLVTTMDRYNPGDTIFLTDSAESQTTAWKDLGARAVRDSSLSPWLNFGKGAAGVGNWTATVVIDPFDGNHAMYGTGQTVWATDDLRSAETDQPTHWTVGAQGIEETVSAALISPASGPYAVSGVWDLGGFVHDSLTQSPVNGMFQHPLQNKVTGLDYAKHVPNVLVRVGYGGGAVGAFSTDSGVHWTSFAGSAGTRAGGGTVAISADASTILYAPSDAAPSYSKDRGATWTSLAGTLPKGVQALSDGADASRMYAYAATGTFYASADQGVSWHTTNGKLPEHGNVAAVYGRSGDVWLASLAGLFRSCDSGATWSRVRGLTSAVSVGSARPATVSILRFT